MAEFVKKMKKHHNIKFLMIADNCLPHPKVENM
jgi:hypothetical protein